MRVVVRIPRRAVHSLLAVSLGSSVLGAVGTVVAPSTHRTPFLAEVTAYCPCAKCCGRYSPERGGPGLTTSGTTPRHHRTLAADWAVLTPGTRIDIPGVGTATVEDTGSAIKGNRIDVFMRSHSEAIRWGRKKILVEVVEALASPNGDSNF